MDARAEHKKIAHELPREPEGCDMIQGQALFVKFER